MRLELGRPVHCIDGPVGEFADVVIDPTRRHVTHIVVEPHHRHFLARLVPVELAAADDTWPAIVLTCTSEELGRLPLVAGLAYLRLGELPIDDPDWDVGVEDVLTDPSFDSYAFTGNPINVDPRVTVAYDRIPRGEVEIRRASDVFSADGKRLGHVDGLVVDRDDRITDFVLERGHLFRRHGLTVAIRAVARIDTDSVSLALTKAEVGLLPAIPGHHRTARDTGSHRRPPEKRTLPAG